MGASYAAPQVAVTWEIKELDHIEDRDLMVLEKFDCVADCALGVQEDSIGFAVPDTEMFALALALARVPALAEDATWKDEGRVIPDLAEALEKVERPIFRFVGGRGKAEMVLEEVAGKKAKEVGRVKLEVSQDGSHVGEKRYMPKGKKK